MLLIIAKCDTKKKNVSIKTGGRKYERKTQCLFFTSRESDQGYL